MTFQAAKWVLIEAYKDAVGLEKDVVVSREAALAILRVLYKKESEITVRQIEARQRTRAAKIAARAAKIEDAKRVVLDAIRPITEVINPPSP
jgi:hypothetical protein